MSSSFSRINFNKRRLEAMFLFVTGRCNSKCAMCFYAGEMDKKNADLSFDEIKKLSETAGYFNRLWISGGEPTLRDELPEIIEMFYRNNHITDVNIPTNGLKKERVIEWLHRLRTSCPSLNIVISISVDGFPEVHDRQRGVPGGFRKTIETLKEVDETFREDDKVIVNVSTVITKFNVDQIDDFMHWIYGRFTVSSHVLEAARGETREDGVKILTEERLRAIQKRSAAYYCGYADRFAATMKGTGRSIARMGYLGTYYNYYDIRAKNVEHPTPWGMDCTAGETTLVIDYDGRFRSCELRDPVGRVQDYDCDVQKIMQSRAMADEVECIGHGWKACCWCTHGCWIMSSMVYNPLKMVTGWIRGSKKMRSDNRLLDNSEEALSVIEKKYGVL